VSRICTSHFTGMGRPHLYLELILGAAETCVLAVERVRRRRREARRRRAVTASPEAVERVLLDRDYAPSTARKYARITVRFLNSSGVADPGELREWDVREHLRGLKAGGRGNATQRLHLCALRAVFDRVLGLGVTGGIGHAPRPACRPAASPGQVAAMAAACRNRRDLLLVSLLFHSGLRPAQLATLDIWQRLPEDGAAMPEQPLPGTCDTVPLPEEVVGGRRPSRTGSRHPASRGGPSARTMRRIASRLSRQCGFHATCTAIRKGGAAVAWRAIARTA
jgi:hypothetical protein